MAMLLVAQFRAAPDAFLNRTAGGEGEMMTSALGKVRTAGTFSFVIGVVAYFALATSFLAWAALRRDVYKSWVLFAAGAAIVIGIAVSGSRSVVGACAVVVASLVVVIFLRPNAIGRLGQTLVVAVVLGFVVMQTPIFKEGFNVLSTRFSEAAEATEKSVGAGAVERVLHEFSEGLYVLSKAPFLGFGLGIGTNAGAKFLTGRHMFLLSEGEWPRIFLESGQLLGLAYVLWRCAIVVNVGWGCLRSVKAGNILPLLIFACGFLPMLTGQFGQPTTLGFAVFAFGLSLAAQKMEALDPSSDSGGVQPSVPPVRRIPRRSEYASRLHGAPTPERETNGANHH
jgi:O-antigen ligase